MLEGEAEAEVIAHLLEAFSPRVLVALLNMHWQKQLAARRLRKGGSRRAEEARDAELAFLLYATLKQLTDDAVKTPAALPLRRLFRQWEAEEGREIVRQIRRIEIVDDEGALGVVYFPMPSWVMAVWTTAHVEAVKKEIVMTVKRDNPEEKLKDFWSQATSQLIDVVKHHRNIRGLRKRKGGAALFGWIAFNLARTHTLWRWLSILMSAVVNVLMMIYLRDCKDGEAEEGATHVCMRDDIMSNNQHNGSGVRVRVGVSNQHNGSAWHQP